MTSFSDREPFKRTFEYYDIPKFGTVRHQSITAKEIKEIREAPAERIIEAAILTVWVDEHGDQIYVINDENMAMFDDFDAVSWDGWQTIIMQTVGTQLRAEDMIKNSGEMEGD